jgi:hypothetical protein
VASSLPAQTTYPAHLEALVLATRGQQGKQNFEKISAASANRCVHREIPNLLFSPKHRKLTRPQLTIVLEHRQQRHCHRGYSVQLRQNAAGDM